MIPSEWWSSLLVTAQWVVLAYFLLVNGSYAVLVAAAIVELRLQRAAAWEEDRRKILRSEFAPRLSMLAPAYNEAATVEESVHALLTLSYPNLEVVLINDGSTDSTLQVLRREFELIPIHTIYRRQIDSRQVRALYRSRAHPNLVVVDKDNGGKADALNAGLNVCSGELVCAMDADTLIETDALLRMVRPFLKNQQVVAAGGTLRIANGSGVRGGRVVDPRVPRRARVGFQVIEYLRAFLFGRLGWNRLGGNLIVSGAFGLFRRDAMIGAGGYLHETVGEDIELVVHLRQRGIEEGKPHRVEFVPDPVAWTEVPESWSGLGRQRDRWHRGLADVMWRYKRLFLNPRYGALGLVVYPYFLVVELLGPVIEALGLVSLPLGLALGALDVSFAALFAVVAYGLMALLTVLTLVLEEFTYHRYHRLTDRLLLVTWALLEPFGYRQLTVLWRLRGLVKYIGKRQDWGVMERRGFVLAGDRG